jgi:phosphotransferase system  glucose/maltose/N-acetylglucosamine-specific IIC component
MTGPGQSGSGPDPHQVPPPGYYYPMAFVPVRRTNTMAILALVLAFVVAPAGIVLGHIARSQIRRTGEDGDGLALAGLIIGYVFTALNVLFIALFLVLLGAGLLSSSNGN